MSDGWEAYIPLGSSPERNARNRSIAHESWLRLLRSMPPSKTTYVYKRSRSDRARRWLRRFGR